MPFNINIPNVFVPKTRAKAAELNQNFEEIKSAAKSWGETVEDTLADHGARIEALEARIEALEQPATNQGWVHHTVTANVSQTLFELLPHPGTNIVFATAQMPSETNAGANGLVQLTKNGSLLPGVSYSLLQGDANRSCALPPAVLTIEPGDNVGLRFTRVGPQTGWMLTAHLLVVKIA